MKTFLRGAFLRSGSLDGILALGEEGLPVYASAQQLRETLRLRGEQQLLDCLAIPQPHEQGEKLDWYSPIEGKVTSWAAAGESQRASALRQLEMCQRAVADISRRAQRAEKAAQKLFGMLLAKTIQFPDQNHVYLVGDKPVLTFWGFIKLDEKSRADPLDCLRPAPPQTEPLLIPARREPMDIPPAMNTEASPRPIALAGIAETARLSKTESDILNTAQREKPENAAASPKTEGRRTRRRLWWSLPVLALAAALMFKLYGYLMNSPVWPPATAPMAAPPVLTPSSAITAPPVGPVNNRPASANATALPGKDRPTTAINPAPAADGSGVAADGPSAGSTVVVAKNINPSKPGNLSATEKDATASADSGTYSARVSSAQVTMSPNTPPLSPLQQKNALRLPASAVKAGSTTFLNGRWRVSVDSKNPVTGGKAVSFDYFIKNGGGVAKRQDGDGISCRAEVHAGLMKSGNLVIKSQVKARCSDGSTFPMPQIVCTQNLTGIADCQSRYDNDQIFPTRIKRENEN